MKKLVKKRTIGKISFYFSAIFFISIFIGVGYAYLNSQLSIKGQTTIAKASWDVHFENIVKVDGNVSNPSATITNNATLVNFNVSLENPGDFYEFTVDVVNKGTIDAMVSSLVNTGISAEQQKFLTYTVTYLGNNEIKEKQLLKSGDTTTIDVFIKYRDDISSVDLPGDDQNLAVSLSLMYTQADSSAVNYIKPICKRATTLHTEVCNNWQCKEIGYKTGGTITYGSNGTSGKLTSGDAFDCDVNGDGVYDSSTERFYYVSGKGGDSSSSYATLVYYNNVAQGNPSNTNTYSFVSKDDYILAGGTESDYGTQGNNDKGPLTAIKQLPTTTQWKNVKLSNTTRNITDEKGTVRVNNFSYSGYAARLLTTQEVEKACGISVGKGSYKELGVCDYLLENTQYATKNINNGYWLESLCSAADTSWTSWQVDMTSVRVANYILVSSDTIFGVRPVIEVPKTLIIY